MATAQLNSFFCSHWLLFPGDDNHPAGFNSNLSICRMHFKATGEITGAEARGRSWRINDKHLQILDEKATVVLQFPLDAVQNPHHLKGTSLSESNSGSPFVLRRLGEPYPVQFRSPLIGDFEQLFAQERDFSSLRYGSEVVRPKAPYGFEFSPLQGDARFCDLLPNYMAEPIFLHVLHDCLLVGGSVVVTSQGKALHDTTYQAGLRSAGRTRQAWEDDAQGVVFLNDQNVVIDIAETAVLFNTLGGNYGHWMVQSVPSRLLVDRVSQCANIPRDQITLVVTNGLGEAFRGATLRQMGLDRNPILDPWQAGPAHDVPVFRFKKLALLSTQRVQPEHRWHPRIIANAADFFHGLAGNASPPSWKLRLFISRKDVEGRRGLVNEAEVFAALQPLGFQALSCGELSFQEQASFFREAEMVVSPHAGALTNMLAAPAGLKIVELFHRSQLNTWYRNMALILGHAYTGMCFDVDEPSHWDSSFRVDPAYLAKTVGRLL